MAASLSRSLLSHSQSRSSSIFTLKHTISLLHYHPLIKSTYFADVSYLRMDSSLHHCHTLGTYEAGFVFHSSSLSHLPINLKFYNEQFTVYWRKYENKGKRSREWPIFD